MRSKKGCGEEMKEKIILGLGLCTVMLLVLSGCTQQTENGETVDPKIKAIQDAGKLVVGTSAPYEPMEFVNETTGELEGFDIDVAEKIATALEVDLEVVNIDWDDLITFNALETGEVDIMISAITITTERSEQVLFSNAYLNAGQVIIVNETNEDIMDEEDLANNKTVGVQNGTTSEDEALKYVANETFVIIYANYTAALTDIIAGNIDAIIIDYPAGVGLIKNVEGLEIAGEPFTDELYGIAMNKGESALKTVIDNVIASGFDDLEGTWF